MATTAVTVEQLTINTFSTDFPVAGSGSGNNLVATTPADGWVISPASGNVLGEKIIFRFIVDATGDTITFKAGDRNPAQRADLGDLVLTMAASDLVFVTVESSRFLKNDGTMLVTGVDTSTVILAMELPRSG